MLRIGALVLALIAAFYARAPILRAIGGVQQPFAQAGAWISGILDADASVSRQEAGALRKQRDAYAVDAARLAALETENARLRELLAFAERTSHAQVTARIIARSNGALHERFVIDRGEDDGVREGDAVIHGDGVLAGKVSDTDAVTATVTSVSDRSFATAASILNERRTVGVVEGEQGGLLRLQFIPHDEPVEIDDLIVTSGLEERIPSGIVIGIVNAVEGEPTDPFITAIIQPVVDLSRTSIVSVLTEPSR